MIISYAENVKCRKKRMRAMQKEMRRDLSNFNTHSRLYLSANEDQGDFSSLIKGAC